MTTSPQHDAPHGPLDDAVYAELKRIARRHLRRGAGGATLSTTDLVHDAYLKFGGPADLAWQSRAHFFGSASRAMRQVLVDHARHRTADKRGGGLPHLTLTGNDRALEVQFDELLVLDEALDRLRGLSERLCQVVELRFFGGMTDEEIAELLDVSTRTVGRDWLKARMYLSRELGHD
jgi:RNA polymerase sigma factor (TIGR02999 family)